MSAGGKIEEINKIRLLNTYLLYVKMANKDSDLANEQITKLMET